MFILCPLFLHFSFILGLNFLVLFPNLSSPLFVEDLPSRLQLFLIGLLGLLQSFLIVSSPLVDVLDLLVRDYFLHLDSVVSLQETGSELIIGRQ